jgi:hypothetical protein
MLEKTTKSDFVAQLHTKFYVRLEGRPPLELELYSVEDGRSTPAQEQFSLFFSGPREFNLGQGTFELEHETMGRLAIFLVSIEPDSQGLRYQAVFNRFVKTQP